MGQTVSCEQPEDIPEERRRAVLGAAVSLPSIANKIQSGQIQNIVVMAGAGISVAAGIPDFRSPGTGLYSQLEEYNLPTPESIFSIDFFRENPAPFCKLAKELFPGKFKPTLTHAFLRLLQDKGKLYKCFTQNIDNLERLAGVRSELLVEAHGSFSGVHCINCKAEVELIKYKREVQADTVPRCRAVLPVHPPPEPPTQEQVDALAAAEVEAQEWVSRARQEFDFNEMLTSGLHQRKTLEALEGAKRAIAEFPEKQKAWANGPKQRVCNGLVKPDIVFFGESLPKTFAEARQGLDGQADLAIIMGTSLQVMPFAGLIADVSALCPRLLINRDAVGVLGKNEMLDDAGFRFEEPDNYRDVFVAANCDDGVTQLCRLLGWEDDLKQVYSGFENIDAIEALSGGKKPSIPAKSIKQTPVSNASLSSHSAGHPSRRALPKAFETAPVAKKGKKANPNMHMDEETKRGTEHTAGLASRPKKLPIAGRRNPRG
jgi:NAD-dependent SIR2 family protein deacetylase